MYCKDTHQERCDLGAAVTLSRVMATLCSGLLRIHLDHVYFPARQSFAINYIYLRKRYIYLCAQPFEYPIPIYCNVGSEDAQM